MKLSRLALLALAVAFTAHADPSGHKWFKLPVHYRVAATIDNDGHSTTIQGGTMSFGLNYSTDVIPAFQQEWRTWTKSAVTNTTWDSVYDGTFTTPTGRAWLNANDGFNSLGFLSVANWQESAATLGLTLTTAINATGEIVDADSEFNNSTVNWDNAEADPTSYDYPSVFLHEAGHFLGLAHTANSLAVMYFSVNPQAEKRVLTTDDLSDVTGVYPVVTGGQGTTCQSTANCNNGLTCHSAPASGSFICTIDCTGGAQCPTGYTCQAADTGKACLPQTAAPDLCKFCTSGNDCSTGICATDDMGHMFCTSPCNTTPDCGPNYTCVPGANLCAPTIPWAATSCPNQCMGTGQSTCPIGYLCANGSCNPTGNDGDRCEISTYCNNCFVCVGSLMQANCRPCCGGAQLCTGCSVANCGTTAVCTGLTTGDSVCVPTTQSNTCMTCSGAGTCPTGENCIYGACHTTCNPLSPGTCTACFDQGGGNGLCACSNEQAGIGQQCGPVGQGFFACQNGLVCTGTPPTCSRSCNVNDQSTCQLGEKCTQMGPVAICVTGTIGSQCAACGTNNACEPGLQCFEQRCYAPCNTSGNTCSSCVPQMSNGDGVCACPDQIGSAGDPCSTDPIKACAAGLQCVQSLCRGQCDPNAPTDPCGVLQTCQPYMGGNYCLPIDSPVGGGGGATGGSGGSGGGGGKKGSGGGGGSAPNNTGCSCNAGVGALWPLLGVFALVLRRRRR